MATTSSPSKKSTFRSRVGIAMHRSSTAFSILGLPANHAGSADDIVVFVVGPTGSGKSLFIKQLLKNDSIQLVEGDQHPRIGNLQAVRWNFVNGQNNIVVVDTPSLNTCDGLDGREIMGQWISSRYNGRCKAAGILYLHNIASSSDDSRLGFSPYLDAFRRMFNEDRAPSTVHVVPTMFGRRMPSEQIKTSMTQLRCEVDNVGASMLEKLFDDEPGTALNAVWELWGGMIEDKRTRLKCELRGQSWHFGALVELADLLLQRYQHRCSHLYGEEEKNHDLDEIITLMERTLSCAPTKHPNCSSVIVSLAGILSERFEKENERKYLDAMITIRRVALDLNPQGHGERLESLVNLANCLDQRFRLDGAVEDLMEIITLRRAMLELTPSGHRRRFAHLVALANILDQRFRNEGIMADLEEIVFLRRAALECTSLPPSDQCTCLVSLANCLRQKVQKSGGMKELNEAITHARAALALCPPEFYSLSRDCLASCVELKIGVQNTQARTGGASTSSPSSIKEAIWKIVGETVKTAPLRLLNTRTGILCTRIAQLSNFEGSREYKELLSSASKCNGQQLEALIRKAVLAFFQFVTLSHRWGDDEPLLRDIESRSVYELEGQNGLSKLQKFCVLALKHGYVWAWSDTCCIDKESSAELQEAIGSMFSWYRHSALTIVHLSDVSNDTLFTDSVWFKRGWTLQELLAPRTVLFYTQDWLPYMNCESLNHKADITVLKDLHKASGVEEWQLAGNFKPGMDDARSRLQWASARRTTRPEDVAYSLFGVFDLHLPVLYGESADKALGRLLAEIISQSGDVSVLDWVGEASSFHSCFPASLVPYQTMPCTRSISSDPSRREGVDLECVRKLCSILTELPFPRFINHTLALPSIVHRVTVVKAGGMSGSQPHAYEVHASGLVPLQLTSSVKLRDGSGVKLPYVLARPWHSKSLDVLAGDDMHAPFELLEQLAQPFNALLLTKSRGRQYKRIATNCTITCRAKDLPSISWSEIQILDII